VGTGLGLWVTRNLVEKHGGNIRLRTSSAPARHGTVFSLFFPASVSAKHDEQAA
jgi:two-component system, NtrC family, sensor kinase